MRRSNKALLFALFIHAIIFIIFILLGNIAASVSKQTAVTTEKEPHRIKVSLREPEKPVKSSVKVPTAPLKKPVIDQSLMPKGSQLEDNRVRQSIKVPEVINPIPKPEPVVQQPVVRKEKAEPRETQQKQGSIPKPAELIIAKSEDNDSKAEPVQEHSRLYSLLSKPSHTSSQTETEVRKNRRESRIGENIKEAYGDLFGTLSASQQDYLIDNQEVMRRITQETLNRVGGVNIPRNLRVNTYNIIEFYLHPNGDISDMKIIKNSGFYILDDTTKETIEYAYSRYPRPKEKTLVRYKVGFYLHGY